MATALAYQPGMASADFAGAAAHGSPQIDFSDEPMSVQNYASIYGGILVPGAEEACRLSAYGVPLAKLDVEGREWLASWTAGQSELEPA